MNPYVGKGGETGRKFYLSLGHIRAVIGADVATGSTRLDAQVFELGPVRQTVT